MNFQDDIPPTPNGNSEHHCVPGGFELTAMQEATGNCQYLEIIGEPLILELKFTFPLEQVTQLILLMERMSSVAVDMFDDVGKIIYKRKFSLQQKLNSIPPLKYWYRGSFPPDHIPTLDNDTFANINTQPRNMQGDPWLLIADSCQVMCSATFLGRIKYSFFKPRYKQMMPGPLQSHASVGSLYTIKAAFHVLKIRKKKSLEFTMLR